MIRSWEKCISFFAHWGIRSGMKWRSVFILLVLLALCVGVAILRLMAGSDFSFAFSDNETIMNLRQQRVMVGGMVGASLGLAGVFLQSLLRNPLAAPGLMGLSAGAGFAVTLQTWIVGAALGASAAAFPAFLGAVVVLILLWVLSQRKGMLDPVTMILVGVIISVILGAATMLVASQMADKGFAVSRWMMGMLREDLGRSEIFVAAGVLTGVLIVGLISSRAFDVLALSEDEARSVGVRIGLVRNMQLICAGLLTTISIVLAGPIGFVGLVCPHIVRVLVGPNHRELLIGSALCGFVLVVGADTLVRLISTDAGRVPLGVVTALVGGPVFLMMLMKSRRSF